MKKSLKPYLSTTGFSLIEVMVAVGLMGIVSLGVMKLMNNMSKGQKSVQSSMELDNFIKSVQGKETPIVTGKAGKEALEVAMEIQRIIIQDIH